MSGGPWKPIERSLAQVAPAAQQQAPVIDHVELVEVPPERINGLEVLDEPLDELEVIGEVLTAPIMLPTRPRSMARHSTWNDEQWQAVTDIPELADLAKGSKPQPYQTLRRYRAARQLWRNSVSGVPPGRCVYLANRCWQSLPR